MPSAPKPTTMSTTRLAPRLFISDSGKSAQVTLFAPAPDAERPFISPGSPIRLEQRNGNLTVCTESGEYLGVVAPKLGRRLLCMIEGGNQYEGAVFSSTPEAIRVVLRETYQHPSQRSKLSFPSSEPSPEPAPAKVIADDIDNEFDAELPEPVDLSWIDEQVEGIDDDEEEPLGVAAGKAMDGGMMDDLRFDDARDEE